MFNASRWKVINNPAPRVVSHPSDPEHCWTFVVPSQLFTDLFLTFLWAKLWPSLASCKAFASLTEPGHVICVKESHMPQSLLLLTGTGGWGKPGVSSSACKTGLGEVPASRIIDRNPTKVKPSDLGLCQDWHNSTVLMAGQDAKLHFISICLPLPHR